MYEKIRRTDISLNVDKKTEFISLNATYTVEDDLEIREIKLRGINLNRLLPLCTVPTLNSEVGMCGNNYYISGVEGEIGVGDIEVNVIKRKTKEMTLEDIEKALGYSIKIVSNKEV